MYIKIPAIINYLSLTWIIKVIRPKAGSQAGFIINLLSSLIAYSYLPEKPSINPDKTNQSMALSFKLYIELTLNYLTGPGKYNFHYF